MGRALRRRRDPGPQQRIEEARPDEHGEQTKACWTGNWSVHAERADDVRNGSALRTTDHLQDIST